MSLAAPYQEHYYVADGSTTSFAFGQSFTALNEIDVKCIIYFEDGTNCVPVFNVNMTTGFINIVSLTKPDGTLLTVPPAGSIVRVFRKTPEAQNITASQLQNYTAKQLERVFDSLVAMIQEISYSDIHKTVRLTETQRDIAIDYLPDDKDQAVIYWDVEERKLMPAGFGQNQVVKSDGVEWLVYNQSEGKVYFIPRQGGNPIPIGKATIHNDLSGRNAPDCHPESAITGLREHLQELRDKDIEIEEDVQTALNRSQEAKDTADEAKETAEHAQTIAGQAKDIAEDAKDIAEGIEDIAQEAKDTADEAKEIAQDAKDIAEGVVEDIEAVEEGLANHIADKANPHEVTKAQVGLGNVDNTSDLNKPISTATQAALDLKMPISTKYGASISLTIDSSTYVVTAQLKDQDNNNLGTAQTIDLPLESVVVSGSYDSDTKEVILVLENGSEIRFSVADLISGLQSEITAQNPLDADLVNDSTSAHKFVSATEKTNWNNHIANTNNPHQVTKAQVGLSNVDNTSDLNKPISTATQTALDLKADKSTTYTKTETDTLLGAKQDTISDLATIRSNAQAGKAASDTIATYGDVVTHNASEFASSTNRINGAPLSNTTSNFYGVSNTAAATVQKEVSIPSVTTLDIGTIIIVQPTVTSTVANSTLKLNDFPAYPMRYNSAAITTSTNRVVWSASFPSIWVFDGTYWVFAGHGLDSNTTYTLNYSLDAGQYTAGSGTYAVTRYSILAQKADGTWEKITATNANYSTGTSKSVNTSGFILNQLRYYGTTTTVASGVKVATNVMYEKAASVDMRYSTNCGATTTWALGDYIYLVGTIGADGLFYLDTTTWWSNALPTTNDGKLYIRLGLSLTAAGYTMSFFDDRPIFYHDGTGIKEYKVADNKQDVISDLATIRSGAGAGATAVQPGDLATVATSGSYNDLSDKPTIPAAQVNSDWNAVSGVAQILNKPTLATVATSGSYNDLSNKPTIPTVGNGTITITQGGITKGTFTTNQRTNATIALDAGGGGGAVDSVNGKTGVVVLTATDVGALPDSTVIPTVNNPTITIKQGGVTKGSFTLNQATGKTIALDAGATQYHPDLFDFKWADHILDDVQWLMANPFSWQYGSMYQAAYANLSAAIAGKTLQSETVAGITVQFYLADDGHKICPASEGSNVTAIYNATGVAWYYIIDTTNQRFKLPRAKHNKYANSLGVAGNGMALGLTDGTYNAGLLFNSGGTLQPYQGNYGGVIGIANSGGYINTIKSGGVTTDPTKSGIIAQQEQDTDQYKYLYFYVGNFTQTALENTAGLNAELFNAKIDTANNSTVAASDVLNSVVTTTGITKSSSGYVKLGNGLIIQWVRQQGTQSQNQDVTLPTAFTSANSFTATATIFGTTESAYPVAIQAQTATTVQLHRYTGGLNAYYFNIIAIGY